MIKKFCFFSLLLFLNNCAAPGTALISPAITGAKTKSAHQASLSLASSISSKKIYIDLKDTSNLNFNIFEKKNSLPKRNPSLPDMQYVDKNPTILLAHVVHNVEISNVYEPEPLP